ncbi:MAG: hypothetical protein U0V48_14915 [Anaerolineales bacterium]
MKSKAIMVRPFTKPDDVHGMIALSKGVLTSEAEQPYSRGGGGQAVQDPVRGRRVGDQN